MPTENTCRRRTRADGEHVPTGHERRQRPARCRRKEGSRDSLFLFIWGLCVSDVGGLVCYIESYKFPDCRVIRIFLFPCSIIIVPVNSLFFIYVLLNLLVFGQGPAGTADSCRAKVRDVRVAVLDTHLNLKEN